jgi:hypothetical protein
LFPSEGCDFDTFIKYWKENLCVRITLTVGSETYEDVPGAPECWVDGYDAGFVGKYDKDRAQECKDIPGDQFKSSSIYEAPFIQNKMPDDKGYCNHEKPNFEEHIQGNNNHNVEIKQEDVVSNATVIPLPNIGCQQNENVIHSQVVPSSSRALIFDTKDLD